MRWLLLVLSILASSHRAYAQGDPRKIIERAIQARGEPKPPEPQAIWQKVKGNVFTPAEASIAYEVFGQGNRSRIVADMEFQGNKMRFIWVHSGVNGWIHFNGHTQDMDQRMLKQHQQSEYLDGVIRLGPALKDKKFTLASLPKSAVEGKTAAGVKVSSPGKPDVLLYFDKATGLLVKSEHKEKDELENKEITTATVYLNYRELNPAAADEATLKAAKLASDGPALLDFLRKQVLTDADRKKIAALIRQLGHDAFQMREKASAGLVGRGAAAIPFLRQAVNSSDLEVARRARECLEQIKVGTGSPLLTATLRLIALRKPAGAAEALLAYLPFATEEELARETQAALLDVALRDGKPDPVLVKALDDKDPKRRAAAAAALGKDGGAYERIPGRRILLTGFKRPSKVVYYRDGKKSMDLEEIDVRFYNKLDDKLFAKP